MVTGVVIDWFTKCVIELIVIEWEVEKIVRLKAHISLLR